MVVGPRGSLKAGMINPSWANRIEDPRVKLVPLGVLRRRLQELPREKKVVTLCKAGLRAYEFQTILRGAGFKDSWVIDGGLKGWPYERFMEKK